MRAAISAQIRAWEIAQQNAKESDRSLTAQCPVILQQALRR
jgi:hypothetical protein